MDRSLWLLLGFRVRAWARRVGRSMGTVRGALLVVVGALVFLPWAVSWFYAPREPEPGVQEAIRTYGPPALALYCLINLLVTAEGALGFSAAEVNFLFPGPLSRRQLLRYKLIVAAGNALLTGGFMALFFRPHAGSFLAALVALALVMLFMQLVPMVLTLLASAAGTRVYNRRRKAVVAVVVALVLVAVTQAGAEALTEDPAAVIGSLQESPVGGVLLAPFSWFINVFLSVHIWPDLAQWAGLSLLVIAVLVALVFALDAHYLEASASASERAYARLERLRRGGPMMVSGSRARLGLPALPNWGGVGPLAWRQLTTALRSPWALLAVVLIFGWCVIPMAVAELSPRRREGSLLPVAAGLVGAMTLFVSAMLPFDFRGDVDRIEVLKTLPLPGWRVTLGQLAAPVLLLTLVQWLTLGVALAILGRAEPLLLLPMAFVAPLNFILFAIDNALFLWFPTRTAAATPGDLQALGRQVLLWMVKLLVLNVVLLFASMFALATYFFAGQSAAAAMVVGWVVLAGCGAAMVPLVALAFRQFDVARDTPP